MHGRIRNPLPHSVPNRSLCVVDAAWHRTAMAHLATGADTPDGARCARTDCPNPAIGPDDAVVIDGTQVWHVYRGCWSRTHPKR
jgi:hypothetical protein